jgi:hypothetical protein
MARRHREGAKAMTRHKLPKYVQAWVDSDGRAHCYFRRRGFPRVRLAVSKRRGRCLSALTKRIKSLKTALHQELG